ncbi:MAG: thioredoxin family protein [Chitinophagaceae bacterium]|nr:thioredoxin family protein [Chitinophagaceae bacterium]
MNIFEGHISGSKPVVADFSAVWSGTDKLVEPVLHEIKEKIGDKIAVIKIDIEKEPALKELYNIRSVPTLIIFKHGKVVWRKNGIATTHEILEHLNTCID